MTNENKLIHWSLRLHDKIKELII